MREEVLRELALFAGAGGGILGGHLLGWRTVCAVEINPFCREVLLRRQMDRCLPRFPIWDDVKTFDGRPWKGIVDVISGGFPCQDISAAGTGAGIEGTRSGLWSEMARIIGEVQPRHVFVENSPLLIRRGLAVVLGDLAEMGFDAQWCRVSAENVGAPHKRDRIWIVAVSKVITERPGFCPSESSNERRGRSSNGGCEIPNSDGRGCQERGESQPRWEKGPRGYKSNRCRKQRPGVPCWPAEPDVGRVAHGVAHRVDRIRALGNGQIPAVAATAWEILK